MGAAASPPVQAPAIPPSEGEAPSQRRYPTRRPPTDPMPLADQATSSVSRPPAKRTKFSGPGEPSHAPQPEPPTEDSRIPVGITPETVIRRPMIAGPPIEGNLDCRDRSFHSETYFDIETRGGYASAPQSSQRAAPVRAPQDAPPHLPDSATQRRYHTRRAAATPVAPTQIPPRSSPTKKAKTSEPGESSRAPRDSQS
ncbi:uncharacterized protein LOC104879410 [Vitis vinifera]|uniref:uncharacterized protein LOC104879410 n=1 Tax=Vitis vinifera TaxID=29760 RepID=UPI00053FD18F|nr:uncharacterized protein LOC104879410 [Vitis vinifera]|eukprot:XP_010650448.1 PREDICTED: uncharacterized protein DKFZp434B061-like [Vitis vinifera]